MADFSVKDDNRDPVLTRDKCRKFMKLVIDHGQEVLSLSLCCRNAVRSKLLMRTGGTDIRQRVSELGLPVPVTEFLQFQHEYEELILQRYGILANFCVGLIFTEFATSLKSPKMDTAKINLTIRLH